MLTGRNQAFFLLASCALAASAHASYAQMRLDGPGLALAFALAVAYGLIVDPALFARIFRYRAALVVGSALVVLIATSAVFLPFIVIAPFAQYLAMRHGRRWPEWIAAWIALQLALPTVPR